jgi:hypothetical protein
MPGIVRYMRGKGVTMKRNSIRKVAKKLKSLRKANMAMVLAKPKEIAPVQGSIIPHIEATIENLERVRRFVSKALNTDLQRELAKLKAKKDLQPEARVKNEIELRDKLEIDWGTIPGVDKPFLKQPGAEKILLWLNLRPEYTTREVELPNGHLEIISSVTFYSKKTGERLFDGPACSCSTMESNFRFRWVKRETKIPQEDADKLKAAGLGKWRKEKNWKTKMEEWVWLDRTENSNIHDTRNNVRQIGQKRTLVKGTRNMGALSEIFTTDPSEWTPTENDEGDPFDERDYAPSGRRIVQEDGKSPSGRYETTESQLSGSTEAAQAVLKQKLEAGKKVKAGERNTEAPGPVAAQVPPMPTAPFKVVHVGWRYEGRFFFLQGDIAQFIDQIKAWGGEWISDEHFWQVPSAWYSDFDILLQQHGYELRARQVSAVPASPELTPRGALPQASGTQRAAPTQGAGEKQSPNPRSTVSPSGAGLLTKAKLGHTSKSNIEYLEVVWKGTAYACYDKKLFPFLQLCGTPIEAELLVSEDKRKVIGIVRLGTRRFTEGHIPEIQASEERPQKTADLFGAK